MINNHTWPIKKATYVIEGDFYKMKSHNNYLNKRIDKLYKIVRNHKCVVDRFMLKYEDIKP